MGILIRIIQNFILVVIVTLIVYIIHDLWITNGGVEAVPALLRSFIDSYMLKFFWTDVVVALVVSFI